MKHVFTKEWFEAAMIRAIRTFAQAAIAVIPMEVSIVEVSWLHVIGCAALAAVLSFLTSLAGLPEVESEASNDSR